MCASVCASTCGLGPGLAAGPAAAVAIAKRPAAHRVAAGPGDEAIVLTARPPRPPQGTHPTHQRERGDTTARPTVFTSAPNQIESVAES